MFTMKNGSPRVVLFVPLLKLESNEYPSSVCLFVPLLNLESNEYPSSVCL